MTDTLTILQGDCLKTLATLPPDSVQCCVTSPPYWGLRSYLPAGHPLKPFEIGTEKTPEEYVAKLVAVFAGVRRALRKDGTCWMNLGDSYASDTKGSGGPDKSSTLVGTKAEHNGQRMPLHRVQHGLKQKDLVGIPWRVAFALQADGWYLRSDIIWSKPNPMPESVTDRPTKAHEYIFLLTKSAKYFYDHEAIKEPSIYFGLAGQDESGFKDAKNFNGKHGLTGGSYAPPGQKAHGNARTDKQRGHGRRHAGFNDRWDGMEKEEQCGGLRNRRSVWEIATNPYSGAHFATFPPALIKPCILAGTKAGDTVLDPFGGSGTTGEVALELGRKAILCELNPEYLPLINRRCDVTPGFKI